MELRDFIRVVRKHWWLVLVVMGIAVGAGAVVTIQTPPQYASSVTFFVTTSNRGDVTDAYQGGLFSQERVKSYADLLTSERLARAIADREKLDMSADEITKRISAIALPETVLLKATVTDGSRERADKIAKAMATEFVALIRTLETPPGALAPTVKVEVVGGPRLQLEPVSPRPVRNIGLAALLGLLLGLGLAVLREILDTTVKSQELLRELSGAPTLVTVAFDASAKKAPVVIEGSGHSARSEAFRQLRTNLQFVNVDRPLKALVLVSAVPGEGKSTTAANLAFTLAQAGSRILLVEADLRRPKVAEYLGVEGAVGLTNVLVGQVELADVIQPWGRSGLFILPSGSTPPNPSELLASQTMTSLLETMREQFDLVVIDAPALLPVTDGALLAARADGALLVVRHGHTTRAQVTSAMAILDAVDAPLLGSVFNMAPRKGGDAYTYHYGYGYSDRTEARPRLVDQSPEVADAVPAGSKAYGRRDEQITVTPRR